MPEVNLKNLLMLVLSVLLVIGVVLTGGCADTEIETPSQESPAQTVRNITLQEAFTLIQDNQNNPDFVIIDVRTAEEFAEEHIENAINLEYRPETIRTELNRLDKNKTYLIYYSCSCGDIGEDALDIMAELNFREAYNMSDGMEKWEAEGLPTTR